MILHTSLHYCLPLSPLCLYSDWSDMAVVVIYEQIAFEPTRYVIWT